MNDFGLSQSQIQVISALSDGANSIDAAAQAGVHRNTIASWRRNSLPFREALAHAQYDKALLFREKAEDLAGLAFETLHAILNDPNASAPVRLKAAMFIIEKASTPPPPKKEVQLDIEKIHVSNAPPVTVDQNAQIVPPVHKNAQSEPVPTPKMSTSLLEFLRRDQPKVGRNEACPCGSGQKFKRCCLNKPRAKTHAQAA